MRVLLIEDDRMIGEALCVALRANGISVDWTRDPADAERALHDGGHALVLLDLGLPGADGLDLLRAVRVAGNEAPILIITARDEVDARVYGLNLGADDYLVKPFDTRALLARMRAVQRRRAGRAVSRLTAGGLELDTETHELQLGDTLQVLSARAPGSVSRWCAALPSSRMGGWCSEAKKGQGTTAELWLPVAQQEEAREEPTNVLSMPHGPSRSLTVLVVDDDPLVLENTAAMLEDLGHRVIEARSGDEALNLLRRARSLDLVITDQVMPGMTGMELAERVRAERPEIRLLLASGYSELPSGALTLPKLSKPFDQAALERFRLNPGRIRRP